MKSAIFNALAARELVEAVASIVLRRSVYAHPSSELQ